MDLLTLDALELAKRAQLPVLDVRNLVQAVRAQLRGTMGLGDDDHDGDDDTKRMKRQHGQPQRQDGLDLVNRWSMISTLDQGLDTVLGGGIPTGYVTEVTGESGAGKTQLLLTLLLSAQLPSPKGLHRPSLYISTEAPLATARLSQLLHHHPQLAHLPAGQRPSLDAVLSITVPDLESQDHILRYQVPVSIRRHSIGLVIIDSVAANYRAEFEGRRDHLANLAVRSADLIRLGALLRHLARTENVAVVVANQVADRFGQDSFSSSPPSHRKMHSPDYPLDRMMLDHQQCWFTGWGDELSPDHQHHHHPSPNVSSYLRHVENPSLMNLKTPSLGHTWTLQIAARIALVKEVAHGHADFRTVPVYDDNPVTRDRSHHDTHDRNHDGGIDKGGGGGGGGATDSENDLGGAVGDQNRKKSTMHWKRRLKVVFAPWVSPTTVTANNGLGIEFVISRTGIHSVSAPLISS